MDLGDKLIQMVLIIKNMKLRIEITKSDMYNSIGIKQSYYQCVIHYWLVYNNVL